MDARKAGIVVSLLVAGLPALAQQANTQKPAAPAAASATSKTVAAQPGPASRRKGASRSKVAHAAPASAVPAAYAAISEPERLAIQSDLAWLGDYDSIGAGDFDGRTVDAIKAFQKRNSGKVTGILNMQERTLLADAVKSREQAVGWRLIEDPATGARLGLPEKIVPKAGAGRTGSRWRSGQGQVQIETFRLREASLSALFEEEKKTPKRLVGYSALRPDSFVIAGEQLLKRFVVRAQARGSEVRGITVLYDLATEGTMAAVAVAVSDTFQGFPDPNAGPLPGRSRTVEYGTAIVVSSRGDLITLEHVTDGCQAITVPGLGHADRIAADKASGLSLIRLYGAHNLAPAGLGGETGEGDDLTLVGIADPLAQSGGSAISTAIAHRTAQGLEPAPKPGFTGAAAIDGQGRFAGIADLTSAIVASAGAGSASPQATLVPADTVRAFLTAHGIVPAASHTAMDQAVVRVICVRK